MTCRAEFEKVCERALTCGLWAWRGLRGRRRGTAEMRSDRSRLGTVTSMAEVVETNDLTAASQDGWAVDYRIRREDGEELHAAVRCWEKAHAAAERAANADALAAIADRGSAAALEYAELVESPTTRGAVFISIWFDPADEGKVRCRV